MAQFANDTKTATHRYPTNIKWGNGYINNDGMKYIIAESHADAMQKLPNFLTMKNLQYKDNNGNWKFCI